MTTKNKEICRTISRIASGSVESIELNQDRLGNNRIIFSGSVDGEFVLNEMNPEYITHIGHHGRSGVDVSESEGQELIAIWKQLVK